MTDQEIKCIPEVTIPAPCIPLFKRIQPKMVAALENQGISPEFELPMPPLEKDERCAWFILGWVVFVNEIIQNLNIILHDLVLLPHSYLPSRISPKARLHLLTRTYFYEFFRFRENLAEFLYGLRLAGVIDKSERKQLLAEFSKEFEEVIQIRNTMVHGHSKWKGEDHFLLSFATMLDNCGLYAVEKSSGTVLDLSKPLQNIVDKHVQVFHREGCKMPAVLQAITTQISEQLLPPETSFNPDAAVSGGTAG